MSASQLNLSVRLTLDYRHPLGGLAPFFEALKKGEALAACCGAEVYFPPRLPADGQPPSWVKLSGQGTVVALTRGNAEAAGAPPICALVAMDGATNMAVGRVNAPGAPLRPGSRVKIVPLADPAFPAAIVFSCL